MSTTDSVSALGGSLRPLPTSPVVLTFGEALLTHRPLEISPGVSSCKSTFKFSPGASPVVLAVGGSELNVASALSVATKIESEWISILPDGPLGDLVMHTAQACGVIVDRVQRVDDGEIGTLYIVKDQESFRLPRNPRPHYQRRNSAFCRDVCGSTFPWSEIWNHRYQEGFPRIPSCLVVSGITPLLGDGPRDAWKAAVRSAPSPSVDSLDSWLGVVLDLNYRPDLGSLESLWEIVKQELKSVTVLVVSEDTIRRLCRLLDIDVDEVEEERPNVENNVAEELQKCREKNKKSLGGTTSALEALQSRLGIPILAICLKRLYHCQEEKFDAATSEEMNTGRRIQHRFSVVVCEGHCTVSTEGIPVVHESVEALGGGDAWLAGFLSVLLETIKVTREATSPFSVANRWTDDDLLYACRRGDLLAALSQENYGDMSGVTFDTLRYHESTWKGRTAFLCNSSVAKDMAGNVEVGNYMRKDAEAAVASPRVAKALSLYETASVWMERTLSSSAILPILVPPPGSKPTATTSAARALLGGGLGPCIEVALRNLDADAALSACTKGCPDAVIGAGTVLSVDHADRAVSAGAKFIVTPGLDEDVVRWCLGRDVPVIPGVSTATEVGRALRLGVRFLKFFPAETSGGPDAIKALSAPYPHVRWMATGGINGGNARRYLEIDAVLCVAGSWMSPKDAIVGGDEERIRTLAAHAKEEVCEFINSR